MEQLAAPIDSNKASLKTAQDAFARQQQLWKGGLTTKEALDNAEQQAQDAPVRGQLGGAQIETQRLRMKQEEAGLENAKST